MLSLLLLATLAFCGPLLSGSSPLNVPRQDTHTISLDYGTFVGVQDDASGYVSWKGIRFADAPVGELRWRAPISPPSQNVGTVNADTFPKSCVSSAQSGSEDCLFLNVFSPIGTTADDTLPVTIWIHGTVDHLPSGLRSIYVQLTDILTPKGGGFESGSSKHFDPILLMQSSAKPFVFVSLQYRLGDFGFMAGSEIESDGDLNAGLLDQRAALRWVQRYIHLFGGDASRVTLWGQSGGAGSIMFHLMANGGSSGESLFHAAIGDSPSLTFTPPSSGDYANGLFSQYASLAKCQDTSSTSALTCLRGLSASKLTSAGQNLIASQLRLDTLYNWAPVLDGNLIQEGPVEAFKAGRFARVPVLFGANTHEGSSWSAGIPDPDANTASSGATETTVYNFLHGQWDTFTQKSFDSMSQLYPLSDYDNSLDEQGAQMYGELRYICTSSMIVGQVKNVGLPAYHYHYNNDHLGDFHKYELQAMFPGEASSDVTPDDDDLALFDTMRQYWTSFITDGVPQAMDGAPKWNQVSVSSSGSRRMLLQPASDGEVGMENVGTDMAHRCNAWHALAGELQV
ncbi:alpha/beta-hydrolase [Dendrothele bispora CBS 962.96]|uniref:Carboxylic ester hydrolase n=1 Tax=Dendrothele bispora (strain CBS 962.96) TaxID=1314807 RepID=A0A4V4HI86_DENBC|nr:alpha/beta-hydrolase [Dendrothele bispora CBS 962.96]